jgi:hypothetical protein
MSVRAHGIESHAGIAQHLPALASRLQGHSGQHAVRLTGQFLQHAGRIGRIRGLAVDGAATCDGGVGTQDRSGRQAAPFQASHGRIELQASDALDIGRGSFAGEHLLQRLAVFGIIGQQQLVAHPELFEQLPPARALRGEVEEVTHGDTGCPALMDHAR